MRANRSGAMQGFSGLILLVWLAGCDSHVVSESLSDPQVSIQSLPDTPPKTPKPFQEPPFPLAPEEKTGNLPQCELSVPGGDYFTRSDLMVGVSCEDPTWDVHFFLEAGNSHGDAEETMGWIRTVYREHSPRYFDSIMVRDNNRDSIFLKVRAWSSQGDSTPVTAAKYRFGLPAARVVKGLLLDSRDGRTYKTTRIGKQVWMAENLNYRVSGQDTGICPSQSIDSCGRYGRFYTWRAVSTVASFNTSSRGRLQGICPSHWHVPSTSDWDSLTLYGSAVVGFGAARAGEALKADWSWNSRKVGCYSMSKVVPGQGPTLIEVCPDSRTGNGRDIWGFAALSAGWAAYQFGNSPEVQGKGQVAEWWGVAMDDPTRPIPTRHEMRYDLPHIGRGTMTADSPWAASLRCVFDSLQP